MVSAGTYTLSESGGPSEYSLTDLSCSNSTVGGTDVSGVSVGSPDVTVANGDDVTCVFTNSIIADISVVKTITSSGPYLSGQVVTYNLAVTNNGPTEAIGVSVDDLSIGLSGIVITAVSNPDIDPGDCAAASSLPCPIADMANGETVTITVQGTVL